MTLNSILRGDFCWNDKDLPQFKENKNGKWQVLKKYKDGFLIKRMKIVCISKEDFVYCSSELLFVMTVIFL